MVWTEGNRETAVSYLSPMWIGSAVSRNRMRRMLREAFIKADAQVGQSIHLAILPRNTAVGAPLLELSQDLRDLISKVCSKK
ncbi:MAG TPA: ribonuclease P protein component [Caldisericia bacterium]|nr:ribonuclease P protein component [Caldisericia bacterium]HPF48881.1 ribonuclease P protein component [Caldisericia bacterium]HPI83255.1 ribonuclease P protein component [Caldisericia bacterium]HPQ92482.1 ribonuclease P protein component [Caldisericia bacterium]